MGIEEIHKKLLANHEILISDLQDIPLQRNMIYREDIQETNKIGKPRFDPPIYQWNPDLYTGIRDHLQDLWNFFESYSNWMDEELKWIISPQYRQNSKKSLIFLIESDVWSTDEIYGDYLIETTSVGVDISYYRRNRKIKSFNLQISNQDDIENWICTDARQRIHDQILLLWDKLEVEANTCLLERYSKRSQLEPSLQLIVESHNITQKLININPEAGMLNLGKSAEHWLLLKIGNKRKRSKDRLIDTAYANRIIDKEQSKILDEIRKAYNRVKHQIGYQISLSNLEIFVNQFSEFILGI